MKIHIEKAGNVPLPHRNDGDAGYDLRADIDSKLVLGPGSQAMISTGWKWKIPSNWCGLLFPRSGLGTKGLVLANGTGVIDSSYTGILKAAVLNRSNKIIEINPGDRICQLVIVPHLCGKMVEVENLEETSRGDKGFGSTGVE